MAAIVRLQMAVVIPEHRELRIIFPAQRALQMWPQNIWANTLWAEEELKLSPLARVSVQDILTETRQAYPTASFQSDLQHVLVANPREDSFWAQLAVLNLLDDVPSSAIIYGRKAHELAPFDARYAVLLGICEERGGLREAAVATYLEAVRESPTLLLSTWFHEYQLRSPLFAAALLDRSKLLFPKNTDDDPIIAVKRGWILLAEQDIEGADHEFQLATRRLPNLGRAWLGLAWTRRVLGDTKASRLALQRASFLGALPRRVPQATSHAARLAFLYKESIVIPQDFIPIDFQSYLEPNFSTEWAHICILCLG